MRYVYLVAALLTCTFASASEHTVSQSAKSFSVKSMEAKVGDSISFRNEDPFVHNIFSLSDIQSFDLGTFAKGESRSVKLEKEGKMEIECAVHPEMKLVVEIRK